METNFCELVFEHLNVDQLVISGHDSCYFVLKRNSDVRYGPEIGELRRCYVLTTYNYSRVIKWIRVTLKRLLSGFAIGVT